MTTDRITIAIGTTPRRAAALRVKVFAGVAYAGRLASLSSRNPHFSNIDPTNDLVK